MDWATRKVLAWRLSNIMDADVCIEALEEARSRHGRPGIFNINTDQGSQSPARASPTPCAKRTSTSPWTGRGRWMDTVLDETRDPRTTHEMAGFGVGQAHVSCERLGSDHDPSRWP